MSGTDHATLPGVAPDLAPPPDGPDPANGESSIARCRLVAWLTARPWRLIVLAAVLAIIPAIVTLVRLAGRHWYPAGDMAQAELHVRGFWHSPPLVGAAGRIESDSGVQGSHPGPSLWFLLYPVYALLGRTSFGLMVSVTAVDLASFLVALWLAFRRGGVALLLLVAALLPILVRASGPAFFIEPWNPWIAVFPFLVFLLSMWAVVDGEVAFLPLAVLAGSHCIQCHTGYILLVAAILAAATLWTVVEEWRAGRERRNRMLRWLAIAAGAGVLIWIPPVIDQLTRTPGNMSILVQHFGSPREPYLPKRIVAKVLASELSIAGPWLTGPTLVTRNMLGAVVTLALWGGAIWAAVRARLRSALLLHGLLGVAAIAAIASVERIFGGYQEYTIRWFWVLTGFIVVASLWTLWTALAPRGPRRAGAAVVAVAVVVAVALGFTGIAAAQFGARAQLSGAPDSALVGALAGPTAAALQPHGRYLVRWWDPVGLGATPFGLVLELERRGFTTGVDQQYSAAALPQRVMREDTADGVLYVVLGSKIDEVRGTPGVKEVASADLRTDAERARYDDLHAYLVRRFTELGRADLAAQLDSQAGSAGLLFIQPPLPRDVADAVSELVSLRLPAAVFLVPPGTPVPALGVGGVPA
jgi:hypothetical protein